MKNRNFCAICNQKSCKNYICDECKTELNKELEQEKKEFLKSLENIGFNKEFFRRHKNRIRKKID